MLAAAPAGRRLDGICRKETRALLPRGWMLVCVLAGVAAPAAAQEIFGPGEEPLRTEEFAPKAPPEELELPPVPTPPADRLSRGLSVYVSAFRFEGSSVFSDEQLAQVTAPYTGRAITSEELLAAADAVTALYADHGYVTSGAVVPDQDIADDVVRIRVIEGELTAVEVEGTKRFRKRFFRERLMRAGKAPVSVPRLERELRLLQRNRYVSRLQARLEPGESLGRSVLHLRVEERRPYDLALEAANDHSPAVGSYGGRFTPSVGNILGLGDELRGDFDVTGGLWEWDVRYELPFDVWDTRLRLRARQTDADVVEKPFSALGIHSHSETYGVTLSQPLWRTERNDLWLRLTGDWRKLKSCVKVLPPECEPFSFLPGQPDPKQVLSVLRFIQDWTWASPTDVIAGRMTWSVGLDVLGATDSSAPGGPDGQFFAWLGQVQWAHRFSERLFDSELVARTDLQLVSDPLLTLEKFAIGGLRTVRGYRENELVRDNGVVASAELRIPVLRTGLGRSVVQLVPFADVGHGWDERGDYPDRTLASLGIGLRVSPTPWLRGELFWGGRLQHVSNPGEYDIQDDGLYFRVTLLPFDALPWTRNE